MGKTNTLAMETVSNGKHDAVLTLHDYMNNLLESVYDLHRAVLRKLSYEGLPKEHAEGAMGLVLKNYLGAGPHSVIQDKTKIMLEALEAVKYDSALNRAENKKTFDKVRPEIEDLEHKVISLSNTATIMDLDDISGISMSIHNDLKPVFMHLVLEDQKTGLFTEYGLEILFDKLHSPENPLSLAMLDLDMFKEYNDTAGYNQADEALNQTARLLEDNITGVHARIHGDEYMLLLDHTNIEGAKLALKRVVDEFPIKIPAAVKNALGDNYKDSFEKTYSKPFTISAGLSSITIPNGGTIYERLIKCTSPSDPIYNLIKEGAEQKIPDFKIFSLMDKGQKKLFKLKVKDLLKEEATKALHYAKENTPVFVYDPALPESAYIRSKNSRR
jgi:diguanylate cyclase (GGDEF)-like protein